MKKHLDIADRFAHICVNNVNQTKSLLADFEKKFGANEAKSGRPNGTAQQTEQSKSIYPYSIKKENEKK